MRAFAIGLAALLAACGNSSPQDLTSGQWIDLSHTFDEQTLYWPTADKFAIETVSEGVTEGGYYYSAYHIKTAAHGGAHLDALTSARGPKGTETI